MRAGQPAWTPLKSRAAFVIYTVLVILAGITGAITATPLLDALGLRD